jgi:hypothetical protein
MVQIRRQPGGPNDPTLRLVLTHALFGAALGLCFSVALVALDIQGLATLLRASESWIVGFALLAGGFMITCGSLAAGTALMTIPHGDDDDHQDGDRTEFQYQPIPVRVRRR